MMTVSYIVSISVFIQIKNGLHQIYIIWKKEEEVKRNKRKCRSKGSVHGSEREWCRVSDQVMGSDF